jgi:GNAT superfamily N-acetyltransferase
MVGKHTIRAATLSDVEALIEFNAALAQETEGKQLDRDILRAGLKAILGDPALGFYTVAECNRQVVGSVMITKEWSDWRNGVFWWIQSVYVAHDYRRQGIYRSLFQHLLKLAEEHNVCGFRLYVERDNLVAQSAYQTLGMIETAYKMYEKS